MFTGIIKELVRANRIVKTSKSMVVQFPIPKGWKLEDGESINIDGVCSTVTNLTKNSFKVFYMAETLDKTSFSRLDTDHLFNLERSLKASDLMGGHFVSGHTDTTGIVKSVKAENEAKVVTISLAKEFTRYLIYKGSVAVNGVSLTVVSVTGKEFVISLIPHTLSQTNLEALETGDLVNIEVDMLAKYIERLTNSS